jgi:hypothetical protein
MRSCSRLGITVLTLGAALLLAQCSHKMDVKKQAYASLKSEWVFEDEFPVVWKGIEAALRNQRITDRDPEEVNEVEMKKISERSLKTDWVYSQSRDKYVEYKVNQFPRKKYLQLRYQFEVIAKREVGGIHVTVNTDEEIEILRPDGSSAGFENVDAEMIDSSRPNELIEKIKLALLAAPNTTEGK